MPVRSMATAADRTRATHARAMSARAMSAGNEIGQSRGPNNDPAQGHRHAKTVVRPEDGTATDRLQLTLCDP